MITDPEPDPGSPPAPGRAVVNEVGDREMRDRVGVETPLPDPSPYSARVPLLVAPSIDE